MRVLHVLDHSVPLHSGYAFRTLQILRNQRLAGIDTYQMTGPKQGSSGQGSEDVGGLTFIRAEKKSGLLARVTGLDQVEVIRVIAKRLDCIVQEVCPDIIHAHSPCLNGLAANQVAKKYSIPLIYEMRASWEDAAVSHGTTKEGTLRYRASRYLETRVLQQANAVTTICDGLRRDIIARGIDGDKVTVVPNAVDPEQFQTPQHSVRLASETQFMLGRRLIGFIGSFYSYEGLRFMLRGVEILRERYPDLLLVLIGGGPQEEELREYVSNRRLTDNVVFLGRVPHEDVGYYYHQISVFVYPRISMRLTDIVTPLKPLESMAAKALVVASDVGGHQELIDNGKNGLLFRANDLTDFVRTLENVLADPSSFQPIRQAGYDYVKAERKWSNVVARYLPVYEDALHHQRSNSEAN